MENNTYDTTSQILLLGFIIGLVFSYSGLIGFLSGVMTGVILEKNIHIPLPAEWTALNSTNSVVNTCAEWLKTAIRRYV